ncbi:MAG: hypothetical protein SNH79_02030 [Rikenellaceae bacterium]
MLLLTVSEFRSNISKYLKMAITQSIAIKSPSGIFNISPSSDIQTNPSPSNDAWFNKEENRASVERGARDAKMGKVAAWDDVKQELGL